MVRGLAGWLWHCGRTSRDASDARANPSIPPFHSPRRHRSSRNYEGEGREERLAMILNDSRSHFRMASAAIVSLLTVAPCSTLPGRPRARPEVVRPEEMLNFSTLYKQHCSGCPGADGKGGAAIPLAHPVYLAIAHDVTMRSVAAK